MQSAKFDSSGGATRWLARRNLIATNPSADLELPRIGRRLPRAVLTAGEAETVLAQAKPSTDLGLRDRTMLEVLYSTGMRRHELCSIRLDDLDLARGTVLVREGKGRKDRMLPLGRRAAAWIRRYLETARPRLQTGPDLRAVFLGRDGHQITGGVLGNLTHAYVAKSGIAKRGSCHLLRHAMATLMLEGGADIRYIQQMLGHARLTTTEIYTQVNITRLAEVHRHTHPAEQPQRSRQRNCLTCGRPLRPLASSC